MAVTGSPLVCSSRTMPSFLLPLMGFWSFGTCSMVVGKRPHVSEEELSLFVDTPGELRREPVARGPQALDLASWGRVLQTKAHQNRITGCCLSPDRRLLATVCLGGCLKVTVRDCSGESGPKCGISPVRWFFQCGRGSDGLVGRGDWARWPRELWD